MQSASARVLTVTAAVVLLIGFMVLSPSAGFLVFCLAALPAAIPAIFGTGKFRIISVVLLLAALGLAVVKYPEFRDEQARLRQYKSQL
ncbi:MAG: hypothetical protein Q8J74_04830 [Candidatus Didemnitutus sp.]|nr:hypothetical protein [Candidatus Didemnitutus sp.]